MNQEQLKVLEQLAQMAEKAEREAKTPNQLIIEGLAEIREQKEADDKAEVDKYLSTSYESATPLEKGSARQRVLEDEQAIQRQELAEQMAQLKATEKQSKNWLNQDIKDN